MAPAELLGVASPLQLQRHAWTERLDRIEREHANDAEWGITSLGGKEEYQWV